jgi:hypothetical protein
MAFSKMYRDLPDGDISMEVAAINNSLKELIAKKAGEVDFSNLAQVNTFVQSIDPLVRGEWGGGKPYFSKGDNTYSYRITEGVTPDDYLGILRDALLNYTKGIEFNFTDYFPQYVGLRTIDLSKEQREFRIDIVANLNTLFSLILEPPTDLPGPFSDLDLGSGDVEEH